MQKEFYLGMPTLHLAEEEYHHHYIHVDEVKATEYIEHRDSLHHLRTIFYIDHKTVRLFYVLFNRQNLKALCMTKAVSNINQNVDTSPLGIAPKVNIRWTFKILTDAIWTSAGRPHDVQTCSLGAVPNGS